MVYVEAGQVEPKEPFMKCIDTTGLVMQVKKANIDVSFAETADAPPPPPAAGPPAGAHGAAAGAEAKPAPAKR